MAKKSLLLRIDSELYNALKKRADDNYLNADEQAEEIIRRSMVSYKGDSSKKELKIDDSLVSIFSREKKGRPRKKR